MSTSSDRLHHLGYKTRFGDGLLLWQGRTLLALSLPRQPERPGATGEAGNNYASSSVPASRARIRCVKPATADEKNLVHLLESYFRGELVDFSPQSLPLAATARTPFQARVLTALAAVPRGETITYAGLAAAAGYPRAYRAVGNLMAANPYPVIIPCHRVIRGDGSLGSYSGGEGWKRLLQEIEGCPFPARVNPIESR